MILEWDLFCRHSAESGVLFLFQVSSSRVFVNELALVTKPTVSGYREPVACYPAAIAASLRCAQICPNSTFRLYFLYQYYQLYQLFNLLPITNSSPLNHLISFSSTCLLPLSTLSTLSTFQPGPNNREYPLNHLTSSSLTRQHVNSLTS